MKSVFYFTQMIKTNSTCLESHAAVPLYIFGIWFMPPCPETLLADWT